MNTSALILWVEARLAERSTWLGLVGVLSSLGVHLAPEQTQLIATLGVAISGGILVFTKDKNVTAAVEVTVNDIAKSQNAAATEAKKPE